MVDVADIAKMAAIQLVHRESDRNLLPQAHLDVIGPDLLTASEIASIWSDALGRAIGYAGDDAAGFEQQLRSFVPSWLAMTWIA